MTHEFSSIRGSNPVPNSSCLRRVKAIWLDIALVTGLAALLIIGILASAGVFNFIGTTNAAYLSFGMYGGAVLLLIAEIVKLAVWYFSQENIANLTNQSEHTPLDSEEGMKRLKSARFAYPTLQDHYEKQLNNFCGVASSVTVLNALGIINNEGCPYTQQSFFTEEVIKIVTQEMVATRGLPFEELINVLQTFPQMHTESVYGDQFSSPDDLANFLKKIMNSKDTYMIANFSRKALGQKGDGHHSPIMAFGEESHSVLILDVNSIYTPYWVNLDTFWQSLQKLNDTRNRSRGLILCKRT